MGTFLIKTLVRSFFDSISLIIFLASLRHFSRCIRTLFNPPEIPGLSNTNSCEGVAVEMLLLDGTNSCEVEARDGGCSVLIVVEGGGRVEGVAVEMLFIDELSTDKNETKDRSMDDRMDGRFNG